MDLHHEKAIELAVQELVARLSSEAAVSEFLPIVMDSLAKLRHQIDSREPSNEQVALLQGAAVGIGILWGVARLNPSKKHVASAITGRVHALYADLLGLEELLKSLEAPDAAAG